jgi:hypothetical protein
MRSASERSPSGLCNSAQTESIAGGIPADRGRGSKACTCCAVLKDAIDRSTSITSVCARIHAYTASVPVDLVSSAHAPRGSVVADRE